MPLACRPMGLTVRNLVAAGAIFLLAAVSASVAVAAGHKVSHTRTYSTPATGRLATAIADPELFGGGQAAAAFARTRAAGATYVRLVVSWASIAPETLPAGFVATDPTSPGYSWSVLDALVNAAESAGLTPILNVGTPPRWAYNTPPTNVNGGSLRRSYPWSADRARLPGLERAEPQSQPEPRQREHLSSDGERRRRCGARRRPRESRGRRRP